MSKAFNGYMEHAFPADELRPLTCTPLRRTPENSKDKINWAINDVLGDYILTLVDTLDTLAVMEEKQLFQDSIKKVVKSLHNFNINSRIQVFEVNIRILGGLLSSHILASNPKSPVYLPKYNDELLNFAKQLADRLAPAFTESPTGLPYPRVNLMFGVLPWESNSTCTACVGTLILEFGVLSRLLNDSTYEIYARNALTALWGMKSTDDLFPSYMNMLEKQWTTEEVTIGAGADSFYEYLLKAYSLFGDQGYQQMFLKTYSAIMKHVRHEDTYIYKSIKIGDKTPLNTQVDSLSAFWPGVQVLMGDINKAVSYHHFLFTIWRKYGAFPERFDYITKTTTSASYPLRPELIESTYMLYQATQNPYYLEVGASMLRDIENRMKTKCGFASMEDVNTGLLSDRMESFFLSETLKYFYLLFDPDNFLHKSYDTFVFSTEGHILSLDITQLHPQTFDEKDYFQLKCPHPNKSPQLLISKRQKYLFAQDQPTYLPLPLYMIDDMAGVVDLDIKSDWFYQNIILPVENGSYYPLKIDRDICDARYSLGTVVLNMEGNIPKNLTVKELEVGLFISSISGASITLKATNMNGHSVYKIKQIDEYHLPKNGIVLIPRTSASSKTAISKVKSQINALESSNYIVNILFSDDIQMDHTMMGYIAQFGPIMKIGDKITRKIIPLMKENGSSKIEGLETGCYPYQLNQTKIVNGNIVVVKRGECNFSRKASFASLARATALIVVNHEDNVFTMAYKPGEDEGDYIRIPTLMVPSNVGEFILKKCDYRINCDKIVKLIGSGAIKPTTTMLYLANKPAINVFLVELEERLRLKWWQRRSRIRKGSGIMDEGQSISCLWQCALKEFRQSCRDIFSI